MCDNGFLPTAFLAVQKALTKGNLIWPSYSNVPCKYLAVPWVLVIVIPQYEYNILVITQVQGEAKDVGNN